MRKKLVCILFCAIMIFSIFTPSDVAQASRDFSVIRVKISVPSSNQVNFYVDGNYCVDGFGGLPRDLYTANIQDNQLILYRGVNIIRTVALSESIRLVQHEATTNHNNFIWLNNSKHGYCRYLGDLEIRSNNGVVELINHIYLEDYLCGVVPHEMSNSWPIEALKAQAVSARTYAINKMEGAKSSAIYDILDTSSNQVYQGYNEAYTNAINAVYQTAGQVLKCEGTYVEISYSASNGGWTDIPQHSWSEEAQLKPYHIIQYDEYDLLNTWSPQEMIEFPKTVDGSIPIRYWNWNNGSMVAESAAKNEAISRFIRTSALEAFRNRGYIANVTDDLEIVGFSSFSAHTHDGKHGGTDKYSGKDYSNNNPCPDFVKADVTMTALAWRYAPELAGGGVSLGDVNADGVIDISDYTSVRLQILGIKPISDNLRSAADVNRDARIDISDYTKIRLHILGLTKIVGTTGDGITREPVTVTFTIDMRQLEPNGEYPVFYRQSADSQLRLMTFEETPTSYKLWRRRYGHGIGLSQRGAQKRAESGHSYTEILRFYYPNTEVGTDTITRPSLLPYPGPSTSANYWINADVSLNVRSGPSTSDSILGTLPRGARINATVVPGTTWCSFAYGNSIGYVSRSYLTPI